MIKAWYNYLNIRHFMARDTAFVLPWETIDELQQYGEFEVMFHLDREDAGIARLVKIYE